MVHLHNGILHSREKKELIVLAPALMELESIMLSEIKPGGEGQVPYYLTFNWNLIKKRKKQEKYNQRR